MKPRPLTSTQAAHWIAAEIFWLDRGLLASGIKPARKRRDVIERVLFDRFVDIEQGEISAKNVPWRFLLGIQTGGKRGPVFVSRPDSPMFHEVLLGALDDYFGSSPSAAVNAVRNAFQKPANPVRDVWSVSLKFTSGVVCETYFQTQHLDQPELLQDELRPTLGHGVGAVRPKAWNRISRDGLLREFDPRLAELHSLTVAHDHDWAIVTRSRITSKTRLRKGAPLTLARLVELIRDGITAAN